MSNKKWLVPDSGLYLELANGLGKHGDDVHYFTPYSASFFPKYSDYAIGRGFEHIKKELYLFDMIDKVDAIACFEVFGNDLIHFLRKHFPNKPILGAGLGEKLENSRWNLKKIIEKVGLPLNKAVRVKGVHALCREIEKKGDRFIKCDIFRGSINSFYAKDYKSVELLMEDWEHTLGAFSEDFEFIIEDAIHTDMEFGVDTFFSGGEYTDYSFWGKEESKDCYIGALVPTEKLPKPLKETIMAFKPVFKELDYRGPTSTEEKILSQDKHYFLDLCSRAPNPLGLLYPEFIENWPEMCYDIACGNPAKLKCSVKYVGCVPLYSKHTKKGDVQINFDPKLRKNIKFMTSYSKDGRFYAIKDSPEDLVCVVVAGDNTVDGLIKQLKKYVDEVDFYGIDRNAVGQLDLIKEKTNEAKTLGITF